MNTNDTTQVEVTPDYPTIDPVRAWKEGYRAGVEAMRDAAKKVLVAWAGSADAEIDLDYEADRLLAESPKQMEEAEK